VSDPLRQLIDWPVPNAAAVVVGPAGVLAAQGNTEKIFALASVTKPLTALAVLVAVEEGAVTLDAALDDPALVAEIPGATLRHLLAHASGLAPERRQRAAATGARRIYSNAGFEVLGERVAAATQMSFAQYLNEAVFLPLRMATATLQGSPAAGGRGSIDDLSRLLFELSAPTGLLHASSMQALRTAQFPGLRGVLPGYGMQEHNDWGLGFEIKADKSPHWTSARNSPGTYGHFGQSGTMFWIDPQAQIGLAALADRSFGPWAAQAWPALSEAVLDAYA
jgi:CubicO group peptidase (beta-lactamase class C family)